MNNINELVSHGISISAAEKIIEEYKIHVNKNGGCENEQAKVL